MYYGDIDEDMHIFLYDLMKYRSSGSVERE